MQGRKAGPGWGGAFWPSQVDRGEVGTICQTRRISSGRGTLVIAQVQAQALSPLDFGRKSTGEKSVLMRGNSKQRRNYPKPLWRTSAHQAGRVALRAAIAAATGGPSPKSRPTLTTKTRSKLACHSQGCWSLRDDKRRQGRTSDGKGRTQRTQRSTRRSQRGSRKSEMLPGVQGAFRVHRGSWRVL